ncbi:MAG: hypothetical protein JETT_2821 [Candidatus Jettenia ecosi]|uniref:Uncharacterized protein n=1 Tax=Candidatus Jettenia ecosi TaxID=2494326 RepID=A0A533QDX5_9BACT|nr:MAG: hypothetical protein JETT_2821 [Candidatus Jettenia ecosi]
MLLSYSSFPNKYREIHIRNETGKNFNSVGQPFRVAIPRAHIQAGRYRVEMHGRAVSTEE